MTAPAPVRPLLLGLGWPPDQTGGLNRYFRDLVVALGDPAAVVIGPARDARPGTVAVSDHDAPLVARVRAYARAAADAVAHDPRIGVVDAHFALYAAGPVRFGALRHLPLVVHFHGPWAREVAAEHASSAAATAVRAAIERSVYRRAVRVVTLSGAFARVLVEDYGVSPWRIEIVAPGVDLERFSPGDAVAARRATELSGSTKVVLAVRRLVPRAGVDVLLDAWAAVDDDATLVIAGDGPERARLVEQAQRLGLARVRFLGAVPDDDLPALYRAADVCVVPSVALEGFGLVVLEALACGTPVITTDVGGLPEAVSGLGADTVVPAGDARALAERLSRALADDSSLPDRSRCRAHAESCSWPTAVARHRQVYADAVAPPRRLDVVFVDHCARLSGGEIALLRTVPALQHVRSHVVTFEDGPLLAELGARGITTEIVAMPERTLDLRRAQVGPRLPWRAAVDTSFQVVRLTRRLRRLRPDVVHTNSLKASLVGGVAARLAGVPSVWHVRDRIDTDALPRPAVALVRRLARRLPHAVIANSASTLASLRLPEHAGPRRVVVPDPVPDEFFAPVTGMRAVHADDELVIGCVGRLAPWKGQDVFLDAFARAFPAGANGHGPGVRARAWIVGDALFGETEYRDALHAQVARLGISDRVTFRRFRPDVRAELARLDVLVHASVQPEPFGQVVVEGMAAGLPVVAANAGGPAEIVEAGRDGLLVTPGDVDALADALRTLAGDPALRRELGERARASAARYRTDAVVPRITQLYEHLGLHP